MEFRGFEEMKGFWSRLVEAWEAKAISFFELFFLGESDWECLGGRKVDGFNREGKGMRGKVRQGGDESSVFEKDGGICFCWNWNWK